MEVAPTTARATSPPQSGKHWLTVVSLSNNQRKSRRVEARRLILLSDRPIGVRGHHRWHRHLHRRRQHWRHRRHCRPHCRPWTGSRFRRPGLPHRPAPPNRLGLSGSHGHASQRAAAQIRTALAWRASSATVTGRAPHAAVTLTSRAPHTRVALNTRRCAGARACLNAGPVPRRTGLDSDAIATAVILTIAMLMMPALIGSVAPAVPAIDAAPTETLAPC